MSSDMWACESCGAEYTSKIAASLCCDVGEPYERGRD